MGKIRTVLGDIEPTALGLTYMHEHVITHPPADVADRDLAMESIAAATRELTSFFLAGGRALVEMTPRDYGRDPQALREISAATGVHIICTTGWLKDKFCRRWVEERTVNELADEMIREIEEGIDGAGVRAGVIKAGSSLNAITPAEEKVFRAAGRAHRETGALISTHTEKGTMALEQIELLRREGVSPERILVGHLDHKPELDYWRSVAQTGANLGVDQIGKEKYLPDSRRIELILAMVAEGYGDQLCLSGDMARASYWPAYGGWGGPGLTYILWRFLPWLRERGLDSSQIEAMMGKTPARLLQLGVA
ncbi:phosphotriesterase family protein [Candidatus Roseilinea sp. NK_OTU-006]|jgi:phosphotriesterase-related protein|uniref:phosphotriesterase family protein n=1 Tax=Candidatus Roseilinea sp. NK_OTU-006 TaxID=2704250 RepID=UPI00145D60AF|nr:phosphotriesterase-related protein [Candidatus Roseilinea sp. NK_OTU-006]